MTVGALTHAAPAGPTHRQAVGLMVVCTLLWATAGVVTRQLASARSFEVTFWRSAFTALSLVVLLPLWQGTGVFARMQWRSASFWISGVAWSVMFTAFMVALTLTGVGNVLVTMAIGPLFTALLARVALGHRLPTRTWVAIAAASAGIAYMFAAQVDLGDRGAIGGMAVALCVPVAAAVQWTTVQRAQTRGERLDLVPSVLVGAVLSTLATLPLATPFAATRADVGWLALLGLTQLAIPCALSVVCARVLKAPEISLLALLEVVFGIALVWIFVGEAPGRTVLFGGTLVIGALVANEWLGMRSRT